MRFPVTRSQISSPTQNMLTPGKILRTYREKSSLLIQDISDATKIPLEQVINIEKDEFGTREEQVFVRGFVKNYSDYLGLDTEKVLAIYRRTFAAKLEEKRKEAAGPKTLFGKRKNPRDSKKERTAQKDESSKRADMRRFHFEFTPKTIALGIGVLVTFGVLIYLITQFYKFQKPPEITLTSPENNITVEVDSVEVKGKTEPTAVVKINNENIATNPAGEFSSNVKLNEGINTIVIKAYKNNSEDKSNVVTRNITYAKNATTTATTTDTTVDDSTKHTVQIIIKGEKTWITLNADSKQVIATIMSPSKSKVYTFTKDFTLVTGKPSTTTVLVDGTEVKLKAGSLKLRCTGGATVSCE